MVKDIAISTHGGGMNLRPVVALMRAAVQGRRIRLFIIVVATISLLWMVVGTMFLFHAYHLEQTKMSAFASALTQKQQQKMLETVKAYALFQGALDQSIMALQDAARLSDPVDFQALAFAIDLNGAVHLLPQIKGYPLPGEFWDAVGSYSALLSVAYIDSNLSFNIVGNTAHRIEWVTQLQSLLATVKSIHGRWFVQKLAQAQSHLAATPLVERADGRGHMPYQRGGQLSEELAFLADEWVEEYPQDLRNFQLSAERYQAERQGSTQRAWMALFAMLMAIALALAAICYWKFRGQILRLLSVVERRLYRPVSAAQGVFAPSRYFSVLANTLDEAIDVMSTRMSVSERDLTELRKQVSDQSLVYQSIRTEVETPILGLMMAIDQLGRSDLDAAQRDHVGNIRQHGRNVGRLISDFLGFASLETDVPLLPWMPCHVLGLVEDALAVGTIIMAEREVELLLRCDGDMPHYARVDVEALNLIVHNLLRHAAQVTKHGDIDLRLSLVLPEEQSVLCEDASSDATGHTNTIREGDMHSESCYQEPLHPDGEGEGERGGCRSDIQAGTTGEGLNPEMCFIKLAITYGGNEPKVTQLGDEPQMYSYHEVARSLERGAGLGLLVAKRKVGLLGGMIRTERKRGIYNCINAYLPYLPVLEHRSDPYQPLMAWRGLKVLIVVSSRSLRTMLSDVVYQWGFLPFVVTSMTQAKELLRNQRQKMDCVICDWDALSMSDTQWYRYFEESTPFYYLTRMGQLPPFVHPLAGPVASLTKPFTRKALHRALTQLFGDQTGKRKTAPKNDSKRRQSPSTANHNDFAALRRDASVKGAAEDALGGKLSMPAPRILLVEDNEINVRVTKGLLNSLGFDIDVAVDGEEGWALICRNKYELVFLDLHLPRLDGHALALRLRDANLREKPKIIALTATAIEEDRQRCLDAGMVDFVVKPFRRSDLEVCLTRWLDKSR